MSRSDGRAPDQLRDIKITRDFVPSAAGSVFIEWGRTRVIVTATVQEQVPPFLYNKGLGWVSAEYGMLPGSTGQRKIRDGRRVNLDGRTVEIQRLIGRSLRTIVNPKALGPRTLWIDCDVVEADAGTRTASITGAWVALYDAVQRLRDEKILKKDPLRGGLAAVSVVVVDGKPLLDPTYEEDSQADSDLNFVMTHEGQIIEVQGTAEKRPLPKNQFLSCLEMAEQGIHTIASIQNRALIRLG
ncbi:MAG TPA: ribonuclease PH [Planctomycetes bacterium]|nr:ribonuclease PH [Planctomycetota bacterium]